MSKKNLFRGFFALALVLPVSGFCQQATQFSQYAFDGLALNPAYAGYQEVTHINLQYRNQYTGLEGSPQTFSFSLDGLSQNEKMGYGFQIIDDRLGAQSDLNVYGAYAYRLLLGEYARLSFGVGAGIHQYGLDGTKLFTVDNDQALSNLQRSVLEPDLRFGIFYTGISYFVGVAADNLLADYRNYDPTFLVIHHSRYYYMQGGAQYRLSPGVRIRPTVVVKEDFKDPVSVDLNLFFLLSDKVWIGGSYRAGIGTSATGLKTPGRLSADSFSLLAEYFINNRIRIGYSFDYSTSALRDVSSGTHEISIGYYFKEKSINDICPRIF